MPQWLSSRRNGLGSGSAGTAKRPGRSSNLQYVVIDRHKADAVALNPENS